MDTNHVDPDSLEEVISISRIHSKKSNGWIPALRDKKSHEIDSLWVAAVLYMIYDRYISCIPDEHQLAFQKSVLKIFSTMIKDGGEEYVYSMDVDTED
jgi:hypothetical protein